MSRHDRTKISLLALLAGVAALLLGIASVTNVTRVHGQQADTWRSLGFSSANVFAIAFSPNFSNDRLIIIGTDGGTFRSTDAGASWKHVNTPAVFSPHVFSPAYAEDHTLFAGSPTGVYRSTDGGNNWVPSGLSTQAVPIVRISPSYATDRTLFAGTIRDAYGTSHVYRSTDGGAGWAELNLKINNRDVRDIAVSPDYAHDHTVFVGVGRDWDWYNGGVFRSTDGGTSWSPTNKDLPYQEVHAMALSPDYAHDHTVFLVVWQGGLYRSTDGGDTWVVWNNDQPNRRLHAVAFSPNYAQDATVFLGAWGEYDTGGIYRSTNRGANWTAINNGLDTLWIHLVVPSPDYADDCIVLAGGEISHGGGLWLNQCPTKPKPTPVPTVAIPGNGSQLFSETNQSVSGIFLDYWKQHGGLAQQGLPISGLIGEINDLNHKPYTVQYFERAVFEYHPENQPPYDVLLTQLGTLRYKQKYPGGAPNQTVDKTDGHYFAETGHWVGGRFWDYWQSHGGLAQQGYPISDEFTEMSDTNGKPYTVQYFERAVFELHRENQPPNDVLLSLLGTYRYKSKYK